MGLASKALEAAGIPSVALSLIPELTHRAGAPRTAALSYPMARPLGRPGDAEGQRSVLRETLRVLDRAAGPGHIEVLPFEWPESPAQARRSDKEPPPIGQLLARKPWLLPKLMSGDIPE